MQFEKAGPREKLFFDPSETKCAIVTCGGLCPGLNDVIRSIVINGHYHYGIRTMVGIRNWLQGFIPQYGYDTIELTLETVSSIHQFGGTILGTSRGQQDPEEIVDSLERMSIIILKEKYRTIRPCESTGHRRMVCRGGHGGPPSVHHLHHLERVEGILLQ